MRAGHNPHHAHISHHSALHIPLDDRRDWQALTRDAAALLQQAVSGGDCPPKVLLLGESFGGCLALRLAATVPHAIDRVVVINPATSFARSYGGIPSAIAATQLLGLFPAPLYDVCSVDVYPWYSLIDNARQAAQAVLVPFLVDRERVDHARLTSLNDMMAMRSPHMSDATSAASDMMPWRHAPAAAASWRLQLLRDGDLDDAVLASIR